MIFDALKTNFFNTSIINYLLLILLLDYYLKVNKYRINIIILLTIIKCYSMFYSNQN